MESQLPIHKQKKLRSDNFLSKPSNDALAGDQEEIPRTLANFKDNTERFKLKKKEFIQYSHIYMHRLQRMRPFLQQQAQDKWKSNSKDHIKIIDKILQLEPGHRCIVTGTIYKDMPLKPNVLKEYAKDRSILPVPAKKSFVSEGDFLVLEDETGRVRLQGVPAGALVTGIPLALKGAIVHGGEFLVEEYCVAGFPPQPDLPLEFAEDSAYVALISGLNLGHADTNDLALSLLADYLGGLLGSHDEQGFNSSLVRVILAGNSVSGVKAAEEGALLKYQTKRQINEEHEKMARPIADLDHFLTQLGTSIPVDVMPGEHDPANLSLPQQPFNACLFPLSNRLGTCRSVTNPYEAEIGGRIFLGTSGQPVANAMRYMDAESALDLMESTLTWRHIAPTVPDTLAAYPFKDDDPFILDQCPHVYFIGNQPQYNTKFLKGPDAQTIRLVSVPEFSTTQTIVLVDLRTLDSFPIKISIDQSMFETA